MRGVTSIFPTIFPSRGSLASNQSCTVTSTVVWYATGWERKEDGKLCVTSVTIILFQKRFRRTFLNRSENINLSEDHHKKSKNLTCHVCHTQAFCRPHLSAVLSRKLTMIQDCAGKKSVEVVPDST